MRRVLKWSFEKSILSSLVIITICLHLIDFGLPPIYPDEAHFFIMGVSMISSPDSELYNLSQMFGYHVNSLPAAQGPYIGALESYLSLPIIYFLGLNVFSVRIYQMIIGISIIILTYFLGKELASKRVGIISSCLITILPGFVFYSRQFVAYDWALLSIILIIMISGLRFFKTFKIKYLLISLVLVGIGVWAYLWSLYFILGFLIITPLFIIKINEKMQNKTKDLNHKGFLQWKTRDKKTTYILIISFLTIGFIPLIIQFFYSPTNSLIPFALNTIGLGDGVSPFEPKNELFLDNLTMRITHFLQVLQQPSLGLQFSNTVIDKISETYVYSSLFFISLFILSIKCIKNKSKKLLGLLSIPFSYIIFSSFTISVFSPIQIAPLWPILIIIIAIGLESIFINITIKNILKNKLKINSNIFLSIIVILIMITQVPYIIENYHILEESPNAETNLAYQKLISHVKNNEYIPVTTSWWVDRPLPIYSDSHIVPQVVYPGIPGMLFDESTKQSQFKLEDRIKFDENFLFIVYTYPEEPNCKNYEESIGRLSEDGRVTDMGYICAQMFFIESAAERLNKKLEIKDFPLPNGYSYFKTYRLI